MNDRFTIRDRGVIGLHWGFSLFHHSILPFGISFLIVVKDKSDIYPNVLESLKPFADQIVLVIGDKKPSWRNFVADLNKGLSLCRFRWVFKWDGDMLPLKGFEVWMDRLRQLRNCYCEVDVGRINASKTVKFGGFEGRLFTQHPSVRYRYVPDRDSLVFPLWFRLLRWDEPFILHLNPK